MDALDLLEAHRYDEAIAAYRERLATDPQDWAAVDGLACSLQAAGLYTDALPLFIRVDEYERKNTHGHPGRQRDISCIYWCLGQENNAIQHMRVLVQGVLNGTVEFGDQAGGIQQGLLLYYMGVTVRNAAVKDYALDYLRQLTTKNRVRQWPGSVALYLLGEIDFEETLNVATGQRTLQEANRTAGENFLSLRHLCVALFYDAVKFRVVGEEFMCLDRMRRCFALENPLAEPEWYLARYEVNRQVS